MIGRQGRPGSEENISLWQALSTTIELRLNMFFYGMKKGLGQFYIVKYFLTLPVHYTKSREGYTVYGTKNHHLFSESVRLQDLISFVVLVPHLASCSIF